MQNLSLNHQKKLRKLIQKKYREESRLFVVEGMRAVTDAMQSNALNEVLVTEKYHTMTVI